MQIKNISKDETLIYKGIGILLIALHNFFHWMPPGTGENEFDFDPNRIFNFLNGVVKYPLEFINLFLSYFGHYGVQIFIFISGLGLALSMLNKEQTWGKFMLERFKKLYLLLITGIIFYFFLNIILYHKLFSGYDYREMLYKLLFIQTMRSGSGLSLSG
ncbi:MAG: acyltransferase, partial [Bacteroidales bacterium]|nr:acyltransferase [Bacteroidales bacterium]